MFWEKTTFFTNWHLRLTNQKTRGSNWDQHLQKTSPTLLCRLTGVDAHSYMFIKKPIMVVMPIRYFPALWTLGRD